MYSWRDVIVYQTHESVIYGTYSDVFERAVSRILNYRIDVAKREWG